MNVVVLNGKSKNKATKNEGNNIIHVRMSNGVSRRDTKQRKQKQRRHRGNGHGYGLREPPSEDPSKNTQHVPACRLPIELHTYTYNSAQERS